MPRSRSRPTNADSAFQAFLEAWAVRQEHYLDELLAAQENSHPPGDEYLTDLVNRVLSHYRQYYQEKSRFVTQNNAFLVFSPPWLTSFEHAFLWIAGFRPGLALRVVKDSIHDLCQEQTQKLNRIIEETRAEERVLTESMAQIQESLAAPPLLALARHFARRLVDGERVGREERMEEEVEKLGSAMESLVSKADLLRTSTVAKVVEMLSPPQNLKFLTAMTKLQVTIRGRGLGKVARGCA